MSLIRPFTGLLPVQEHAADVLAPPYDVLSTAEARACAGGRPWSFLHVTRPEIDLPDGVAPDAPEVYAKGRENFARMVREGVLRRAARPGYYVYRLEVADHLLTGLVVAASLAAYDDNRIRKHEYTRPEKEDDRLRHIDALDAQTGPVMLTHRTHLGLRDRVRASITGEPVIDVTGDDRVRHALWVVDDAARIAALETLFDPARDDAVRTLYIADGHHRAAAASRVAARRRRTAGSGPDAPWERFLAVLFPSDDMRILDYNRVVHDLGGLSREGFLAQVRERFSVRLSDEPIRPRVSGEFGMYLPGQWYRLVLDPSRTSGYDPVARLDVSLLADHLLAPVLGIVDPRRDARIDFVGGIRGLGELERRVDCGGMAVAFSLFPTSLGQLMAVADAGKVMPPKSTWFEPKLADGMISYPLDGGTSECG